MNREFYIRYSQFPSREFNQDTLNVFLISSISAEISHPRRLSIISERSWISLILSFERFLSRQNLLLDLGLPGENL